jgi:hypothetical protein
MSTTLKERPPRRPVCPLCPQADLELIGKSGENWMWKCPGDGGHREPQIIEVPRDQHSGLPNDGVMAEAGLFEDLPGCLVAGDPWVEHAVVERRYGERHPDQYQRLVEQYGHRTKSGHQRSSVSNLIARALEFLERSGHVTQRKGPATGCFEKNSVTAYWALPSRDGEEMLSWEDYARRKGLDPTIWDLVD